ncbi:unnamed protein product [Arctia plantaginis]|uniref:Uncharacterized protein n=1 Tax=Arctia plantaginis TaxID=874455 RepID=A0A8S0YMF3_ARCPL|nr:unnamed protein product [Arctia plantaginis]
MRLRAFDIKRRYSQTDKGTTKRSFKALIPNKTEKRAADDDVNDAGAQTTLGNIIMASLNNVLREKVKWIWLNEDNESFKTMSVRSWEYEI